MVQDFSGIRKLNNFKNYKFEWLIDLKLNKAIVSTRVILGRWVYTKEFIYLV